MKRIDQKRMWILGVIGLIVAGVIGLVGCQKKSDGGGPGPVVPGVNVGVCPGCADFANAPVLLAHVRSQTTDGLVVFDLDIRGIPMQPCSQPANKLIHCASGPGTMVGYMNVTSSAALCGAPAGVYTIRPLSPSMLSYAMLSGGTFEAVGPNGVRIVMQLESGILAGGNTGNGLDANSTENRIGLTMSINASGGWTYTTYGCGMLSTF